MTRPYAVLVAIASALCLLAALGPMLGQPPAPVQDVPIRPPGVVIQIAPEPTRIVREAESGAIVPPMEVFEVAAASGGKYVMTPEPPGENEAKGGQAEFKLDINDPGKYNLWLRVEFDDSCDDSLDAKVGGREPVEVANNTYKVWQWVRAGWAPFDLESGALTLAVKSREDGSRLDQILLTRDLKYVPVGVEALR